MNFCQLSFTELTLLTKDLPAPFMLVDLDAFESNLRNYLRYAKTSGKTIRLATKSLRVPKLIEEAKKIGKTENLLQGLMCFCPHEAWALANEGHDDLLIAYPQSSPHAVEIYQNLSKAGKIFSVAIDSLEQLQNIAKYWDPGLGRFPVCLDVDISFKLLGLHLGARRSSLTNPQLLDEILAYLLKEYRLFNLVGLLTYEAQVASLQDNSPFTKWLNPFKKVFRQLAIFQVARERNRIQKNIENRGFKNFFINAGGSGSIESSSKEAIPTEITVGSGLLESHIFDYISGHHSQMAMVFALDITRIPNSHTITCHSGGFIASGEMGRDKFPLPVFPPEAKYFDMEMAGEVQTPLHWKIPHDLKVGDRVWFRPSKAGEISERFNFYYLMRNGKIIDKVPTYRGLGHNFF